jgi:hypothetical protein
MASSVLPQKSLGQIHLIYSRVRVAILNYNAASCESSQHWGTVFELL